MIIARYGGILDQSERAHLYNNRCNYAKYIFISEITCGYRAGHLSLYSICLLLTEVEDRVVSYGLSFFLSDMYVSSAKREGYKSKRKKWGSETHSMDRVDDVSNGYLLRTVYLWDKVEG